MDYSMKKGVSLSTLRRYIKAGKVQFKIEQGRYLLFDADGSTAAKVASASTAARPATAAKAGPLQSPLQSEDPQAAISRLEKDLQRAREEIAELKTLIALYEETVTL